MFTVVGTERKRGTYEGRDYDNTILHCTYPKETCTGDAVVSVKIKTERLESDIPLGSQVSFLYDRFGNCVQVDVLE